MSRKTVSPLDFFKYAVGTQTVRGLHSKNRSDLFAAPTCHGSENRFLKFFADHQFTYIEPYAGERHVFDGKNTYLAYAVRKNYGEESLLVTTGPYSGWIAYPSKRHQDVVQTRRPLYPYPTIDHELLRSTSFSFEDTDLAFSLISEQDICEQFIPILLQLLSTMNVPVDEAQFHKTTQDFYSWAKWHYVMSNPNKHVVSQQSSK